MTATFSCCCTARMIFFDDDIGNCTEVSDLGVTCVKVNSGLSFSTWQKAMQVYADMMANGMHMGRTLTQGDLQNMTGVTRCSASDDYSGSALLDASSTKQSSGGSPEVGTLKWYRQDKGYGFIQPANGSGDVFIGSRSLGEVSPGSMLPGLKVGFRRVQQSNGKDFASALHLVDGEADGGAEPVGGTSYPCFSMSQPFAALLVNGAKTLESRNSPMLSELEGQRVALHVGRRDWQGLDKHVEILRKRGLDDSAIRNLSELPAGGRRGDVVALLTLGKTWAPGAAERRSAALADGVLAPEEGIGKYVTEVTLNGCSSGSRTWRGWMAVLLLQPMGDPLTRAGPEPTGCFCCAQVTGVQVLSKPFKCSGQPGLWGCTLPDSSIQAP